MKRDSRTNLRNVNNNWDFWTLLPEALHQVTILMSDRGISASYRHMNGFSSHTFSFINKEQKRSSLKFYFKTQQGIKNLTEEKSQSLIAKDRESHQRDLLYNIDNGNFPKRTMYAQIMEEQTAETYSLNPFDVTKVWPHGDFPLLPVGEFMLNRNSENYFAGVEQSAFSPASVVPGISFSPDKMLQGRLFSYGDAQRYRLGVNHHQIPVNSQKCPYHSYHRDGAMRTEDNYGGENHTNLIVSKSGRSKMEQVIQHFQIMGLFHIETIERMTTITRSQVIYSD